MPRHRPCLIYDSVCKPSHVPCFDHTLNLVVKKALSLTVHVIRDQCRKAVTFFRSSINGTEKLSIIQQHFPCFKSIWRTRSSWCCFNILQTKAWQGCQEFSKTCMEVSLESFRSLVTQDEHAGTMPALIWWTGFLQCCVSLKILLMRDMGAGLWRQNCPIWLLLPQIDLPFIGFLATFYKVLGDTKLLSDMLQSPSVDLARAVELINALQDTFQKYIEEAFCDELWREILNTSKVKYQH